MKFACISIAASALLWATTASAQDAKQDFSIVNKTGYDISEIYVSPSNSNDWEDELLGDDQELEDGEKFNVHFAPKVKTCKWDLKVTYSDDDSNAVWQGIDLCSVSTITIFYDRKSDKTRATFD